MKSFTITLPNKKADARGVYKQYLLNQLNNSYPELTIDGIDGPETETSYQYIGPGERVGFGCNPRYHVSKCMCPFNNNCCNYNLATDFERALKKLHDYAEMRNLPRGYDYKIGGLPVREYDSYVQVGNTIIPKRNNIYCLENLSPYQRKFVLNFIMVVNKTTTVINL